jgi:prepilin-type N-terminal cleavage/methylation domain-containing protein
MDNKGFTLLELLVTVAIIGLLAAAATTAYVGVIRKAARSEAYTNLESLRLLQEQFYAENGSYTVSLGVAGKDNMGNVQIIQNGGGDPTNAIPGFRPGNAANFSYWIVQNAVLPPAPVAVPFVPGTEILQPVPPNPPCFVALAAANTGTRVAGDVFAIDCNNIRNF